MLLRTHFPISGARILCLLLAVAPAFGADKKKADPEQPVRATRQPVFSIPVGPLGFAPPGELYIGARVSQSSLDFLDEDHLLFTFRVAGLLRRDARGQEDPSAERRIRAVVLRLPQGTVEADATWTVHDRAPYLYLLDGGQFLFRDRDTLFVGDASLKLKPFLHFPGKVLWVELDPTRQYIVAQSTEPPDKPASPGDVPSPATANANIAGQNPPTQPTEGSSDIVLRIVLRSTGQVFAMSHIKSMAHVPLNHSGFVESVPGHGSRWELNFNRFTGGTTALPPVVSFCAPLVDFLSDAVFLVTGCDSAGEPRLTALTTEGRRLWENPPVGPSVWPVLVYSQDGARFARETLMATHDVNARAPLGAEDIKGQDVQIIDSASGKIVLRAAASPVLDAGGNVAISPSDHRVAILMEGALRIFQLAAPPPLPAVQVPKAAKAK